MKHITNNLVIQNGFHFNIDQNVLSSDSFAMALSNANSFVETMHYSELDMIF